MTAFTPADVAAYVERSRKAQGLPPRVDDEATARRVAAVLVSLPVTEERRVA